MATNNPYAGAKMVLRNGDPLEELRFGKSNQAALSSSTGEFNAYNKRDLMNSITQLMQAVASGEVVPEARSALASSQERTAMLEKRREVLASSYNDTSGKKWASLGAAIAGRINEQAERDGFLRRLCNGDSLRQGQFPTVHVPSRDTIAVVAISPVDIGYQWIRTKL